MNRCLCQNYVQYILEFLQRRAYNYLKLVERAPSQHIFIHDSWTLQAKTLICQQFFELSSTARKCRNDLKVKQNFLFFFFSWYMKFGANNEKEKKKKKKNRAES